MSQERGEPLNTLETEGQMLQRVMPALMGMKNILALNDEAHHCYRERSAAEDEDEEESLTGGSQVCGRATRPALRRGLLDAPVARTRAMCWPGSVPASLQDAGEDLPLDPGTVSLATFLRASGTAARLPHI